MKSTLLTLLFATILQPIAPVQADDLFVAVGYGGRRIISTDGLKWEITAEWAQPGGDDGRRDDAHPFAVLRV